MRAALRLLLPLLLAASGAKADCKDDVIDILDRSTLAGPYRTEAAMLVAEKQILMMSEVVPPSDMRSRTTIAGKTREFLKIADRVWFNGGNGWREAPPAVTAQVTKMESQTKKVEPSVINAVECEGSKSIEGRDLVVYSYKVDVPGGKGSSDNTLYVDPKTRLPARLVVEARVGQARSRTEMTYVFDPAIKLAPPQLDTAAPPGQGSE